MGLECIVGAAANDESNQLLQRPPPWGLTKVAVIPLQNFEDQAEQDCGLLGHLKAALL